MARRLRAVGDAAGPRDLNALPDVRPRRVLFVFVDGVGLGPADPERNPLAAARLPVLREIADGRAPVLGPTEAAYLPGGEGRGTLRPIDATLGVEGRPQSGTGQVSILAGVNAAVLYGRHFGPWVPTGLRDLLARENLFRAASRSGATVAFANAYPTGHMLPGGRGFRRPGAFPFAARAAGVLRRDEADLRAGRAVVSSITTETWRRFVDPDAPPVSPVEAGAHLAEIAGRHDLTVFAHFDTDHAGHRGGLSGGIAAIERVDRFLGGVLENLPDDLLLVLTSDHGNLEDVSTGHTRNPVPLIAYGPGSGYVVERVDRISDLAGVLLDLLERRGVGPDGAGDRAPEDVT